MRDLTFEECEFVAGASYTSAPPEPPPPDGDPPITVTGHPLPPPPPPAYDPPPPPPPILDPPPPGGSGSGGDSGGGSVDDGALSSALGLDLHHVHVSTVVLGGHTIKIETDDSTVAPGSPAYAKAMAAIAALQAAYPNLNAAAQADLAHLNTIVFTDQVQGRSYSSEVDHTFVFAARDFADPNATAAFNASDIIHDASHIATWDQTHDLNQSRGTAAEVAGWQLQVANAAALGLTDWQVQALRDWIAEPSLLQNRIDMPPGGPTTGGGTHPGGCQDCDIP